jgi:beta-glucanase (GH16 family)
MMSMKKIITVTATTLCLVGTAAAQETLLWSDEFDSGNQPDSKFWSYDIGYGIQGWGNQELQYYTSDPANVSLVDGALRIRAQEGPDRPFTSARIKTEDKLTILYGTVEARIKVPNLADGLWPAFWTLGNNFSEVGWPFCGELDIMEMGNSSAIAEGVINRRVGSTAHWDNDGTKVDYGLYLDAPQDLNDDWHIFRMEWTPNNVSTYLDGELIWVIDIRLRPSSCPSCTEFHEPHFLILNLAVGGTYTGRLTAGSVTAPMPADMLVDWVRVYDNGFTKLGGSGAEDLGPPDIGPGHSGSWYNAEQDGHGFSMEFGELNDGSPFAVVYWYTYDSVGNPIFLVGSGVPDGNGIDLDFVSPVGMEFGVFDPESVERQPGGTGRIEFADDSTANFSYEPSAFTVNEWGHSAVEDLPLTKLFGIPTAEETFAPEE